MLTALNYCTAAFPRQGELRLQLQKMQSCSIFLTILHQAMQRKMSTKPHFWTYLSQIPFCIGHKSLFLYLSQIPFLYLSQISSPTSTLSRDQTACTYDHLMKPSQVLWLQKYLLEWVDLSLLGLSRVFRIKTNRLCGVVWTRFENSVIVSFLAVSWMVVSRVFLFKTNRLCCVMWRRFENVNKSFMLGSQCFLKILSKYPCWAFTCFFWVFLANTGGLCCVTSWKFLRNQDLQIILPRPHVTVRSFPDMDRWTLGWQLGVMCPKFENSAHGNFRPHKYWGTSNVTCGATITSSVWTILKGRPMMSTWRLKVSHNL